MSSLPLSRRAHIWFKRTVALPLNRWYHSGYGQWQYNRDGVDLFETDWDNLFILDACRYDTFERLHDLPGELSKRESLASTTPEFLRANLLGRELHDTVYVTAQVQIRNHDDIDSPFHRIVDVWEDGWDADIGTVLPETVAEATIAANERYPDKRLLVHFLQPHYPFIGETGRKHFDYSGIGLDDPAESDEDAEKFWDTVGTRINDVPEEIVWRAYEENLEAVLPHVERLMTELGGKTVVTADHGEMIYERAWPVPVTINGHPGGLYTPELVEVPWHTYTHGERREVTAEPPEQRRSDDVQDETVEQRLRDLGYA